MSWIESFEERLPALGHRNWVIVADAAYPEQCSPGIRTTVVDAPIVEVAKSVSYRLFEARHVRPVAVLDQELFELGEDECPGVGLLRTQLLEALSGIEREPVWHETLLETLARQAQTYTIEVIKTPSFIPYSSVFFRLECGYWGAESESEMRKRIAGRS